MELRDRHVVVTGGGSGIGAALARRLKAEGAAAVVVADVDGAAAERVAAEVGGLAVEVDLRSEAGVARLVEAAEAANGAIDVFCSNAGITGPLGGPEAPDDEWRRTLDINVMAHVWAARLLLPGMLERRGGHLMSTSSAAGLLATQGAMAYTVSKHAALAAAEYLAMTYGGDSGVSFSCFCPQGVATPMLAAVEDDPMTDSVRNAGDLISPEQAAEAIVAGIRSGTFLILSHPEVETYVRRKADDHDRWLRGMQRMQARIDAAEAERAKRAGG